MMTMTSMMMRRRQLDRPLKKPLLHMIHLPVPMLQFGYKQQLTYPRDGLYLFGPSDSTGSIGSTRFGIIGTPEGVRCFNDWSRKMTGYIAVPEPAARSRSVEPQHVPFPGYASAFRSEWSLQPTAIIDDLDPVEIERVLHLSNRYEAIHNTVTMYASRLIRENNRLESLPSFWFVVIPEIVYRLGRPQSKVPKQDQQQGEVKLSKRQAEGLKSQPSLFESESQGEEVYEYAPDFRRQLKARLLMECPAAFVPESMRQTGMSEGPGKSVPARELGIGLFWFHSDRG
jgi:hypothetical protein